jgi:hypothetical protein
MRLEAVTFQKGRFYNTREKAKSASGLRISSLARSRPDALLQVQHDAVVLHPRHRKCCSFRLFQNRQAPRQVSPRVTRWSSDRLNSVVKALTPSEVWMSRLA